MTPLHQIDLGQAIEAENLKVLIKANWNSELVRGIMQTVREFGYDSIAASKEGVKEQNPAWIHAQLGRHDACEAIVSTFYTLSATEQPEQDA